jgi:hypothetical protein
MDARILTDRFAQVRGLEVSETADGLVVFNPKKAEIHSLNSAAAVIFVYCEQARDLAEITEELRIVFGLKAAPSMDVEGGVRQLLDCGLLTKSPQRRKK